MEKSANSNSHENGNEEIITVVKGLLKDQEEILKQMELRFDYNLDAVKRDLSKLNGLENRLNSKLEKAISNQDTELSYIKSNHSYMKMQFEARGNLPEQAEHGPKGHGLLEPRSSWGKKPLYNR